MPKTTAICNTKKELEEKPKRLDRSTRSRNIAFKNLIRANNLICDTIRRYNTEISRVHLSLDKDYCSGYVSELQQLSKKVEALSIARSIIAQ